MAPENENNQRRRGRSFQAKHLGYIVAAGLAVPIGAVAWFQALYIAFGLTGKDPPALFNALAAVILFGFAFVWPLIGAHRVADVVLRACRLGMIVVALLPLVAVVVLVVWESASERPDLGMGGMMVNILPLIAFGIAIVLAAIFGLVSHLVRNRLRGNMPANDDVT